MKNENIGFGKKEFGQNQEKSNVEKELIIEGVVFGEIIKKDGSKEFRSSAPDRKIMILKTPSVIPEAGRSYRIRVIEDTKPEEKMEGKMIVEITLDVEKEQSINNLAKQVKDLFAKNKLQEALELLKGIQTELSFETNKTNKKENIDIDTLNKITNFFKGWLEQGVDAGFIARGLVGIGTPESMALRKVLTALGKKDSVAKGLAGVGTPESMIMRKALLADGLGKYEIVQSLAGVGTPEAMAMRNELIASANPMDINAISNSLAGVGTPESITMREQLISGKQPDPTIIQLSLAGVDTKEAMLMHRDLTSNSVPGSILLSLVGIGTPYSMAIRKGAMDKGPSIISMLARGLAGVSTPESMALRKELIDKFGEKDNVAKSLAGVSTSEAMVMREELIKKGANMESIANGLAGVNTKEAFEFRDKYFIGNNNLYSKSFTSDNYFIDAVVCSYGFDK